MKKKPLREGLRFVGRCCSAVRGVWRADHRAGLRPLRKGHELAGAGVSGEVQWG